jgi:hypothetical protein
MDQIIDNMLKVLEANLRKEGRNIDQQSLRNIKENLKAQFMNLPEDKRHEILGLIASQLKNTL